MKVAKWGNSLAIRIPKDVVQSLGLEEGDEVELSQLGANQLGIARAERRQAALEEIKKFNWILPADYKFDRDEANAR